MFDATVLIPERMRGIQKSRPAPSPSQRSWVIGTCHSFDAPLQRADDVEEVVREERLAFPNSPAW